MQNACPSLHHPPTGLGGVKRGAAEGSRRGPPKLCTIPRASPLAHKNTADAAAAAAPPRPPLLLPSLPSGNHVLTPNHHSSTRTQRFAAPCCPLPITTKHTLKPL
ncbi:hypothetical protein PLESTM_001221000 [Pleodorina starrii]|nr:hypothetical protein PLESTM_001221000 [Pleodorina starrii]